jgi:hypothetical protein
VWIAVTCLLWLAHGRRPRPAPVPEIPGDTCARHLTRPVVLFAVLRALALAAAVGIAFGLHLPNASWLEQSTLVAEQRLAGTILGAALAILFLLTVNDRLVHEGALVVLSAVANSIRYVNYALYTAAVAATALIAVNGPPPLRPKSSRCFY